MPRLLDAGGPQQNVLLLILVQKDCERRSLILTGIYSAAVLLDLLSQAVLVSLSECSTSIFEGAPRLLSTLRLIDMYNEEKR